MRDSVFQVVIEFLRPRLRPGASLLLGFSGGVDSLALYQLLKEARRFIPFELHLAHIDHGWRDTSAAEAAQLERECEGPFHLHRLEKMKGGDLENRCRDARLAFFKKVYDKIGAQALMLAHHQDDQVETVLKRIFEGGNPVGLESVRMMRGMEVWRPLLPVSKEEIIDWVEKKGLVAIDDPTNRESRFLRGRMRTKLIPELERLFGKGIRRNIARLGARVKEMDSYLAERVAPHIGDSVLDCKELADVEVRYILGKQGTLSREAIDTLIHLMREGKVGKRIDSGEVSFEVAQDSCLIIKHKGGMLNVSFKLY